MLVRGWPANYREVQFKFDMFQQILAQFSIRALIVRPHLSTASMLCHWYLVRFGRLSREAIQALEQSTWILQWPANKFSPFCVAQTDAGVTHMQRWLRAGGLVEVSEGIFLPADDLGLRHVLIEASLWPQLLQACATVEWQHWGGSPRLRDVLVVDISEPLIFYASI